MYPMLNLEGIRRPDLERQAFERRHPGWPRPAPEGPLYCLPEATIERLRKPRLKHPPLLDDEGVAAERDLLTLCLDHWAVGFLGNTPIAYPFLDRCTKRTFRQDYPDWGYTEAQWAQAAELEEKLATANLRLKGYAGWLSTEPRFLDEAGALEGRWRRLPDGLRPGFPLHRAVPALSPPGQPAPAPAPPDVAAFAADFGAFCDRWGLLEMATWDLPQPQGPLLPSLLPQGAPALPRHGIHIVLPLHYPLAHDDDLLRQIHRFQRQAMADLGIDTTAAGLPHHDAYATILEVVHWERVITGRYGRGPRRPGFIGLVVEAIAEATGREVNLVEKWRKAISACRRGRRSAIKALRVAFD